METSQLKQEANASESNVRVLHHIDRVNLYDFGYEKSGSANGDPSLYVAYLDRILNGDLVVGSGAVLVPYSPVGHEIGLDDVFGLIFGATGTAFDAQSF